MERKNFLPKFIRNIFDSRKPSENNKGIKPETRWEFFPAKKIDTLDLETFESKATTLPAFYMLRTPGFAVDVYKDKVTIFKLIEERSERIGSFSLKEMITFDDSVTGLNLNDRLEIKAHADILNRVN